MKRRDFVKISSSVVLGSGMSPFGAMAYGQVNSKLANLLLEMEDTDRVLVMVFLNGGNDGLNTLVPMTSYDNLVKARPNIAQPFNTLIELPGTGLGLHGSMGAMKRLYDEEKLAIIQNVGYENPNFSHFRSTDIWMSGSDSDEVLNSGWTGRYLSQEYPNYPFGYPNAEHPHPLAIEIGNTSSLLFQGPDTKMGLSINDPTFFYKLIDNVESPLPPGPAGERIELIRILQKQSEQYSLRVKEAAEKITAQSDYPDLELAAQLKIVSRLIAGGLKTRLYLVQLRGFDTHAGQVENGRPTQGWHSQLLNDLSESIHAFVRDTAFLGIDDRVLGMVFSEFGRRIKGNFSNGSDHGTAGPLFLFGTPVKKGVLGNNPDIPETVNAWDNLDHEFDYRQVYASIFDQWFCVPQDQVRSALLREYDGLDIIKPGVSCNFSTPVSPRLSSSQVMQVYPSPASDQIHIEFLADGEPVRIQLMGMDGRIIQDLASQRFTPGSHKLTQDISALPAGHYFLRWVNARGVSSVRFVKK